MTDQAAVVILNWNGRAFLARFMPALVRHTPSEIRIVVVDNASGDDSMDFLARNYPQVIRIKKRFQPWICRWLQRRTEVS